MRGVAREIVVVNRLLDTNATLYREIVAKVVAAAPEALILVVTDPSDPLADLARIVAGQDRVLSTGTFLDSLRFRSKALVPASSESGSPPPALPRPSCATNVP